MHPPTAWNRAERLGIAVPLTLVAHALSVAACGGASDVGESGIEVAALPIVGGQDSGPSEDSAVYISRIDGQGVVHGCAGVLVAANLVFTTRSCVADITEGSYQ